ncbi:MAG TPA: universal stress protein [Bacteroidota bacterium]|jgi:nucleotide-binding universal stress UspA family protein|nr:universal stress protein [Bacteroidota bacterium]
MKQKASKPKETAKEITPAAFRLHRILVPIDFSEHSRHALSYALSVAKQFHSEILLVYVVETTVYPAEFGFGQVALPSAQIEEEFMQRGKRELDKLVRSDVKNQVECRAIVAEGKPAQEILTLAQKEEVDMIVIATHGHTGVEHLLFGSTTEKVVRKAPCPVLVVR